VATSDTNWLSADKAPPPYFAETNLGVDLSTLIGLLEADGF